MSAIKSSTGADNAPTASNDINETRVIEYLRQHPDFFRQHPQMLGDLSLPHATQGAASLLEKQVAVLRERSISTRHKLSELLDAAKNNDELFEKTQHFVLSVLTANTLEAAFEITLQEMQQRFEVESASILVLSDNLPSWQPQLSASYVAELETAKREIPGVVEASKTFCSVLRDTEAAFIFKDSASNISSAAIALRALDGTDNQTSNNRLLFAVAHHSPEHYNQQTGTLFVDFIADILQVLTNRLTA
jgi:hypothetical protein